MKANGTDPLSRDTVKLIKRNLNFTSIKDELRKVASVRLGVKVTKDLSWTHTRLLEEVAAKYDYTFKGRIVQQQGPNDDSLFPQVLSMFKGTISVKGIEYQFTDWINQEVSHMVSTLLMHVTSSQDVS